MASEMADGTQDEQPILQQAAVLLGHNHTAKLYRLSLDETNSQWETVGIAPKDVWVSSAQGAQFKLHVHSQDNDEFLNIELPVEELRLSSDDGDSYISFQYEGHDMSLSLVDSQLTDGLRRLHPAIGTTGPAVEEEAPADGVMDDSPAVTLETLQPTVEWIRSRLQAGEAGVKEVLQWLHSPCRDGAGAGASSSSTVEAPTNLDRAVEVISKALESEREHRPPARALAGLILETASEPEGQGLMEQVLSARFPVIMAALAGEKHPPKRFQNLTLTDLGHVSPIVAMSGETRASVESLLQVVALRELHNSLDPALYRQDVYDGQGAMSWDRALPEEFLLGKFLADLSGDNELWSKGRDDIKTIAGVEAIGSKDRTFAGIEPTDDELARVYAWLQLVYLFSTRVSKTDSARALRVYKLAGVCDWVDTALRQVVRAAKLRRADLKPLESKLVNKAFALLSYIHELDQGPAHVRSEIKPALGASAGPRPKLPEDKRGPQFDDKGARVYRPVRQHCADVMTDAYDQLPSPSLMFGLVGCLLTGETPVAQAAADSITRLLTFNPDVPTAFEVQLGPTMGMASQLRTNEQRAFLDWFLSEHLPWLSLALSDAVLPEVRNTPSGTAAGMVKDALGEGEEDPQRRVFMQQRYDLAEALAPGSLATEAALQPNQTIVVELLTMLHGYYAAQMRNHYYKVGLPTLITKVLRAHSKTVCLSACLWLRSVLHCAEDTMLMTDVVDAGLHTALVAALVVHGGMADMVHVLLSSFLVAVSPMFNPKDSPYKLRLPAAQVHRHSALCTAAARARLRGKPLVLGATALEDRKAQTASSSSNPGAGAVARGAGGGIVVRPAGSSLPASTRPLPSSAAGAMFGHGPSKPVTGVLSGLLGKGADIGGGLKNRPGPRMAGRSVSPVEDKPARADSPAAGGPAPPARATSPSDDIMAVDVTAAGSSSALPLQAASSSALSHSPQADDAMQEDGKDEGGSASKPARIAEVDQALALSSPILPMVPVSGSRHGASSSPGGPKDDFDFDDL